MAGTYGKGTEDFKVLNTTKSHSSTDPHMYILRVVSFVQSVSPDRIVRLSIQTHNSDSENSFTQLIMRNILY